MMHRHPAIELELFHVERRGLERSLTIARQLNEGRELHPGSRQRAGQRISQVLRSIRPGLKAQPALSTPSLPSGQLFECAE